MDDEFPDELQRVEQALRGLRLRAQPNPQRREEAQRLMREAHQRLLAKQRRQRQLVRYTSGSLVLAASVTLLVLGLLHQPPVSGPANRSGHTAGQQVSQTRGPRLTSGSKPMEPYSSAATPQTTLAAQLVTTFGRTAPKVNAFEVTVQSQTDDEVTAYVARYPVESQYLPASSVTNGLAPNLSSAWYRLAVQGALGKWAQAVPGVMIWLSHDSKQLTVQPISKRLVAVRFDYTGTKEQVVTIALVDRATGLVQEINRTASRNGHIVSSDVAHYRYWLGTAASGT
jgi:hypothetical protein